MPTQETRSATRLRISNLEKLEMWKDESGVEADHKLEIIHDHGLLNQVHSAGRNLVARGSRR